MAILKTKNPLPIKTIKPVVRYLLSSMAASNTATYTQTGNTVSIDNGTAHNIPATNYDGCMVYVAPGSGLLTAGWYPGFSRTGANTFTFTNPISQSTSGVINSNTANTLTPADIINGGTLGSFGMLRLSEIQTNNNNANSKITRFYLNSVSTLLGITATTATTSQTVSNGIYNRNSVSKQITTVGTLTIDTSSDLTFQIGMLLAAANDYLCVESYLVEILP